MKNYLTRQEYCLGVRCPGLLWTLKNRPDTLSPYSERNIIARHNSEAARRYTDTVPSLIRITGEDGAEAESETAVAVAEGALDIADGFFTSGELSCRCDLLSLRDDGTYALYIVRAAAHLRQTVCHDASYQVYVLAMNGVRVSRVFFVKLNTSFVKGETDDDELFLQENISNRVASLVGGVRTRAANMLSAAAKEQMPRQPIHNGCFNPSDCENRATCFASLPEDNIFAVSGVSHDTKFRLYRKGKCSFGDMLRDDSLSPVQKRLIEMYINDEPPTVDKESLKKFLSGLWFPLCYLDFETMQLPFPLFEGLRPFEPCAFQFSLHVQESENAPLRHVSCIVEPGRDPRRVIAEALCENIPDGACVTAYNMQLEKMTVDTLAQRFDDLAPKLRSISASFVDMMRPFEKRWYYDAKMKGACSLKAVVHALYPDLEELDYSALDGIHNGQEATTAYAVMISDAERFENKEAALEALERYCSIDTLALARLYEKLREAAKN